MKDNSLDTGKEFLNNLQGLFHQAEKESIKFEENSGKKHPVTIEKLGDALSFLYRAACCYWGCNGKQHTIERLVGKSVNQAICAFNLYRGAYYDESLMLTRGIGEIANLLYLFESLPNKIEDWKTLSDKKRLDEFSPSKVRKLLRKELPFVPVDDKRYWKLCEIGTHPNPNEIPGHYTESGIPILGMIVQPVGSYVAITELSYAIGLITVITPKLLKLKTSLRKEMNKIGIELIRNLGAFDILNYRKLLKSVLEDHKIQEDKNQQ